MADILRRYTFRMYPNAAQAAQLEHLRIMACRLYNALVEQRRDAWDRRRISLTKFDQGKEMTRLARHPDFPEWRAFPSGIRERVAERVDQAFRKYFDNIKAWKRGQWQHPFPPRPPFYQKSVEFSGFGLKKCGMNWKVLAIQPGKAMLYIQSVGNIRVRGRFPATPSQIRTADVLWRDGHWEISIVAKFSEYGLMRSPTQPVSNLAASNFLTKTSRFIRITCADPQDVGQPQEGCDCIRWHPSCADPQDVGQPQAQVTAAVPCASCADPQDVGQPQECSVCRTQCSACADPQDVGQPQEHHEGSHENLACADPQGVGKPQALLCVPLLLPSCSGPQGVGQPQGCTRVQEPGLSCADPQKKDPGSFSQPRGRRNAMARWRRQIARRDHAIHEYTSWLAARGGNITVERPPLRAASRTGAGTSADPGALVAFKARMNRDLLDRGIGKFCAVLQYKVEARGNTLTVIEREDHEAMIPEIAAQVARQAKRLSRLSSRRTRTTSSGGAA